MSDNIILVSADGHGGGDPEMYRPYMDKLALDHFDEYVEDEKRFAEAMKLFTGSNGAFSPENIALIDTEDAIGSGGYEGAWDARRRLEEMDREGVVAEGLIHGHQFSIDPFFAPSSRRDTPLDLRASGLRAHHRWLADQIAEGDGRFLGIGDVAGIDMDATVAELQWCAEHDFMAVQLPGLCQEPALPPLYDTYYEPFWDVCSEAGLRVVIHGGWGAMAHGQFIEMAEMFRLSVENAPGANDELDTEGGLASMGDLIDPGARVFALDGAPRRAMWQMMTGGVFDRHPDLTVILIEARADWLPATLQVFDERFARGGTPLKKTPSEYFAQNFYVAPSSPRDYEVAMRHEIGVDRFLFGRDYPHPEGTWPNTHDWIRAAFAGVPEHEARRMLGENAVECFGLDRTKMAELAARIGPKPEDVLGQHPVAPALIEHFHVRSGYSKPVTEIDAELLTQAIDDDLSQMVAP
jgi:predicted TIM-barrel fold metal-dependent hydrolase